MELNNAAKKWNEERDARARAKIAEKQPSTWMIALGAVYGAVMLWFIVSFLFSF